MPIRPTGKRRPVRDTASATRSEASPVSDADEAEVAEAEVDAMPASADVEPADVEATGAEAIDGEAADVEAAPAPGGKRRESWRRRSATGAILTGFALGLQEVFESEKKEPAIVMETSGDPPRDLPVEAELEVATTRRSVVRIRPWLLDDAVEKEDHPSSEDD